MRGGTTGGTPFGGIPVLQGDTVAYVAVPIAQFSTARLPAAYDDALRFNRDRMLALVELLTQRMPASADAFEAMTGLLEARDEIIGTPNGRYSALSALERARVLSTDAEQRLRLAAADVRLHLKLGDFGRAAATTDSVLNAERDAPPSHNAQLAALAALAGRTGLATRYLSATKFQFSADEVPSVKQPLSALTMRAALGVCDDSTRALPETIIRTMTSYVGPADRQRTVDHLLGRPLSLAVSCLRPEATLRIQQPLSFVLRTQQVAARGDRAGVRRMLDSLDASRRGMRPGSVSIDAIVEEAWLAEFSGDAQGAAARLDVALTALPTLSAFVLTEPVMSASVGRAMAYRAELASRLGDPSTAALWASRVLTLWSHADASLAQTLGRMRRLAARQPLS
jgi:hypothetical protein